MRKLCVQLVKKTPVPELSEDLDQFTGTTVYHNVWSNSNRKNTNKSVVVSAEVIANVQALQSLTVDRSVEEERQKAEVKHILLQKQRALSDLFKMLAQIGQSHHFNCF